MGRGARDLISLERKAGYPALCEKYDLNDWHLPGHGEVYEDCGEIRARGCRHREDHPAGIDGRPAGVVVVEYYKRRCMRAECPVCYESWAGREAGRAEHRLKAYKSKFRRPIHVTASVPKKDYCLDYKVLRSRLYKMLKKCGVFGGCVIFHHLREDKDSKKWYFSPHFHVVGYGWVRGTDLNFQETGWIIKNIGIRKTVSGTLLYQLSHAGIKKGVHTVTWFGACAYNKLKVPPYQPDLHLCPICGAEFEIMDVAEYTGLDPPREGVYYSYRGVLVAFC